MNRGLFLNAPLALARLLLSILTERKGQSMILLRRNMKHFSILLLIAAVILFGCGRSRSVQEESTSQSEANDREIVEAIHFSYGLEEALWENEENMDEREDVLNLLRKGFGEEKAQKLTDYFWIEEKDTKGNRITMLRSGDPLFILPRSIEVVRKTEDKATALLKYEENPEGPLTWKAHTVRVTLKKENGTWKIFDAHIRRY